MKMQIWLGILALLVSGSGVAGDWGQWRGPERDGSVVGEWPETLAEGGLVKRWEVELAEGYASPIVVGDRVFTVETAEKEREVVRALNRESGAEIWQVSWDGAMKVPFFASKNGSWVRSTPAYDGEVLYVGGMRDVLVALDGEDGSERWRVDYPAEEETPLPSFGFVASPLIVGDALYVQAGSALRRLDKATGETQWKAMEDQRAMYGSAFSSPRMATIAGKEQVLVQTRERLAGVIPESGEVLWETPVKAFRMMNILTPTPLGDRIFTASYGGGLFLLDVKKESEQWAIEKSWGTEEVEGYMSSPVVVDGLVYVFGRDKHVHCVDPEKEELLWSSKKKFGDYWSMVTNGKRILGLDERGKLFLVEPSREGLEVLGEVEVSDRPTWAHLVVCGTELYIRDLKGITCWDWN